MIDIVRELTGAAMITLPSSRKDLRQSRSRRPTSNATIALGGDAARASACA